MLGLLRGIMELSSARGYTAENVRSLNLAALLKSTASAVDFLSQLTDSKSHAWLIRDPVSGHVRTAHLTRPCLFCHSGRVGCITTDREAVRKRQAAVNIWHMFEKNRNPRGPFALDPCGDDAVRIIHACPAISLALAV